MLPMQHTCDLEIDILKSETINTTKILLPHLNNKIFIRLCVLGFTETADGGSDSYSSGGTTSKNDTKGSLF